MQRYAKLSVSQILDKYMVSHFQCSQYQALQTETPYWLDVAYKRNLSDLDTGTAQRNLDTPAMVSFWQI